MTDFTVLYVAFIIIQRKNDFAKIFKTLAKYADLK